MIILKFFQHQWIFKIWNKRFLLLIFKLFAAHSLSERWLCHERWLRFSTYKLFASFVFSTRWWSLSNSPSINKNILFEVIVVFYFIFRFSHMNIVCWGLILWKKGFTSVSLLSFTKKLRRSSYDVTRTHHNVILIMFLFRFVVNVQDL